MIIESNYSKASLAALPENTDSSLLKARAKILSEQFNEGFWYYSLEANESIAAEFVLISHCIGNVDLDQQSGLCRRMLSKQSIDGSWGLYFEAPGDLSSTVECYMALKLAGYALEHPAMLKARDFILKNGGITGVRVFTRIHLALFGIAPWSACPALPISLALLPKWSPINIYEFSSWARATIVPLLLILYKKPVYRDKLNLDELFKEPSKELSKDKQRIWEFESEEGFFSREYWLIKLNNALKFFEPLSKVNPANQLAIKRCENYILEHTSATEDIFPALAYSALALHCIGYGAESEAIKKCFSGLKNFQQIYENQLDRIPRSLAFHDHKEIRDSEFIHQQCCVSPVWDTGWNALALLESDLESNARMHHSKIKKSLEWLLEKQVTNHKGDWSIKRPDLAPGAWAFEFDNIHYPDVDDTILILTFLYRYGLENELEEKIKTAFDLGLNWVKGMQSSNGAWAAFDVDNQLELLNRIPFSDHGACLDSPTSDITARVLELLGTIREESGESQETPYIKKAIQFILEDQNSDGSWWGRWGINHLYGTWCVLTGLSKIGFDMKRRPVRKAVKWLKSIQHEDGGWGESPESYEFGSFVDWPRSTASQSSWAILALIAAGEIDSIEVKSGIKYLIENQNPDGSWAEAEFTGTGFPGHFYLRYHGYSQYFPTLTLAAFRKTKSFQT